MAREKRNGKPAFVEIEWWDAWLDDRSAKTIKEVMAEAGLYRRFTRGFFVGQTERDGVAVTVLAHDWDPPQHNDEIARVENISYIPTGWIVAIRYRSGRSKKVKQPEQVAPEVKVGT